MENRALHHTVALSLIAFFICLLEAVAATQSCACKYQKAHSEASTVTCVVREDMAADCDLVWSMPNQTRQTLNSLSQNYPTVFEQITQSAATLAGYGRSSRQLEQMKRPNFWSEFQEHIKKYSGLPEADPYDHAIAFISDKKVASTSPQTVSTALIFVSAADLRRSTKDTKLQDSVIRVLLLNSDNFGSFVEGGPDARFADKIEAAEGSGSSRFSHMEGLVVLGCFEYYADQFRIAEMIKAEWATASSGRCR
jgi:hypothetical protein